MAFNVYEVLNFVDVKKCILNNIRASDKIIHVFCHFHKNFLIDIKLGQLQTMKKYYCNIY